MSLSFLIGVGPSWLVEGVEILSVLDPEPGLVRLLPISAAEAVVQRQTDLSKQLNAGHPSVIPELHRLQDRYRRVRLDSDGRITLPLAVTVHLAAVGASTIFVATLLDHVELWSVALRSARLATDSDQGDGLP